MFPFNSVDLFEVLLKFLCVATYFLTLGLVPFPCLVKNKKIPWCIPDDYQKYVEPWNYHEANNLSLPWKYEFTFDIFDIQEINDRKQTVTIIKYC